jgi:hypothetical protein
MQIILKNIFSYIVGPTYSINIRKKIQKLEKNKNQQWPR